VAAAVVTFFIPAAASEGRLNTTAPCVTTGIGLRCGLGGPTMKRPVGLPPSSSIAGWMPLVTVSARCTYGQVGMLSVGV
jgi:hypothetical protein